MKTIFQIFLFFLTWFNLSATPSLSNVAFPSHAVSFLKAENQNKESEVKIGVSNFARSGISENLFSQKAVLWESSVLENRSHEVNIRFVSEAGNFFIKAEGNVQKTLSKQALANIMNSVPANKKIRLLSCNDETAAKELSALVTRPFYASDDWVDIYHGGDVYSKNKFYKYSNGSKNTGDYLPHNAIALNGLGSKVRMGVQGAGNDLLSFVNKTLTQKLDDIKTIWNTKYPIPDMLGGRSFFEDVMGQYRYTKSTGWNHTGDISFNVKGIDFYKGTQQGSEIYASTAVSMKTTIKTNVDEWLQYQSIKDNIKFLDEGLSTKGLFDPNNSLKMFMTNAEIHIYMPKANITEALKTSWMNKLNTIGTKIKFEIKALEDFIQ